jgi:hypothetical protein
VTGASPASYHPQEPREARAFGFFRERLFKELTARASTAPDAGQLSKGATTLHAAFFGRE